jgi:hypothetical protein
MVKQQDLGNVETSDRCGIRGIYNISMLLPPEAAFITSHLQLLQSISQTHN